MAAVMADMGLPPDFRGEGGRVIVVLMTRPAAWRHCVARWRLRGRGGPGWLPSGRGGSGCPGMVAGGVTVAAAAAWPSAIPEPCHASRPGNWPGARSGPPQRTFPMISTW